MPEHRLQRTRDAYREDRVWSIARDIDEMLRDAPAKTPWDTRRLITPLRLEREEFLKAWRGPRYEY